MSHTYTIIGAMCAALLFGLAACDRGGPAEKAGRELDRAVDKAGKQIEKAGERAQDAAKGK
jgi:hypothetical protein